MANLTIKLQGDKKLAAWLEAASGGEIDSVLYAAMDRAVPEVMRYVQKLTPTVTRALQSSITGNVRRTATKITGRVFSDLRYAPFVERGTRQHGPAHRMFATGRIEAASGVHDDFLKALQAYLETVSK